MTCRVVDPDSWLLLKERDTGMWSALCPLPLMSRLALTSFIPIGIVQNMRKNVSQNPVVYGLVTDSRGHTFWCIDETSKVCTSSCSLASLF